MILFNGGLSIQICRNTITLTTLQGLRASHKQSLPAPFWECESNQIEPKLYITFVSVLQPLTQCMQQGN